MTSPQMRPSRSREPRTPPTPAVASIDRTLTVLTRARRTKDPDPGLEARIDSLLETRTRLTREDQP